ncbi:MAG: T9SS type A sorting domain-containing protein [Bacteroidetes bacterium]|nr:T9SS type A sorting domain-containing protein [Bacteroidota bacterium]
MKAVLSLFFMFLSSISGITQTNLIITGDFENTLGATIDPPTTPCGSFTSLSGWTVSHGTPQMVLGGDGADGPNYVRMWSMVSGTGFQGEGITANLTQPVTTRMNLTLCFWYRTYNAPGFLDVILHNTPPTGPSASCGSVPAYGSFQIAITPISFGVDNQWNYVSIPIVPDNTYNYLAIYPRSTTATAQTQNIHIDGVSLLYCEPSLIIDHTFPVSPAGFFVRQNYIQAGSRVTLPSSPIPVSVNPTINTTFRAGNFVLLDPDFVAQPNNSSYFLAEIGPCLGCEANRIGVTSAISQEEQFPNECFIDLTGIPKVFPNPANNQFTLQLYNTDLAENNALLQILDLSGRTILEQTITQTQTEISTAQLPAGTYLWRVHEYSGSVQQGKLIITH